MKSKHYDYYKELHPEWSEEQLIIACSLAMETDKTVDENTDIDPNDPDVIRGIIEGARNWLQEVLPDVFAKVGEFFDYLINCIGHWIGKGLSYLIDVVDYLYKKGETVVNVLK